MMGKLKQTLIDQENPLLTTFTSTPTLTEIAMVKAWNFCMEYDPYSGRETERAGSNHLKEGYIEGFLAGFAHKFESETHE
jgi:hypothetical protein